MAKKIGKKKLNKLVFISTRIAPSLKRYLQKRILKNPPQTPNIAIGKTTVYIWTRVCEYSSLTFCVFFNLIIF